MAQPDFQAAAFVDYPNSAPTSTALYPVGTLRAEGGKLYMYQQADDAFTAGQTAALDISASATGKKVTPGGATGNIIGIAEQAVTDEYYFWLTIKGYCATAAVADGVAAGQYLSGAASGVLNGVAADITAAVTNHNANSTFSDTEVEGMLNALGTAINATLALIAAPTPRIIALEANSSGSTASKAVYII